MFNINLKTKALQIIFGMASFNSFAQDSLNVSKTNIAIETDPATFVFKGYAAHIRIKPKNSKHLILGAGVYALDLPKPLVEMNKENKGAGWNVRINSAFGLFGEYYLKNAGSKWFIGFQTSIQNYKITTETVTNKTSKYSNLLIMPSLGYVWNPFKIPLYIKPWMGIGYTSKISGDNHIDTQHYHISSIIPFATLHIGYTFK